LELQRIDQGGWKMREIEVKFLCRAEECPYKEPTWEPKCLDASMYFFCANLVIKPKRIEKKPPEVEEEREKEVRGCEAF